MTEHCTLDCKEMELVEQKLEKHSETLKLLQICQNKKVTWKGLVTLLAFIITVFGVGALITWANAKDVPEIKQDLKDKTTKDAQQDTDIKVLKTRQDAILKNTEIILTKLDELSKDKNRSHNRNDDRNE